MSRYVPVKGYSGLVRDTETNALINTNASEIEQAREQKRLRKLKKEQEQNLMKEMNLLKNDVNEIKKLLNMLLTKL